MRDPEELRCADGLIGRRLCALSKLDYTWFFEFGEGASVHTESSWRFSDATRIVVTSHDEAQPFCLYPPHEAIGPVRDRALGRTVVAVDIDARRGDLTLHFGDELRLEFLQMSCGYEGWRLTLGNLPAYCLGGGARIAIFRGPD